jgi:hypothetical protein
LFGLIDENDIDLVFFQWDLMLFQELNHTFDLINKDFDLRCQFLIITDNLHHLSQQVLVFWEFIWILNNTLGGVLVESLEIGQDNLHLIKEKGCVDINPFLDLYLQGISETGNNDSQPTNVYVVSHLLDFSSLVFKFSNDLIEKFQWWDSSLSTFQKRNPINERQHKHWLVENHCFQSQRFPEDKGPKMD